MDVDGVLCEVGEFGKYQKLLVFLVFVPCTWPMAFAYFGQLMAIRSPPLCCLPGEPSTVDVAIGNSSMCISGFDATSFSVWSSESAQEFLLCESTFNVTIFQIITGVAGMIGGLIAAGIFENKYGRTRSYFIMLAIDIVFAIASAFAADYWSWLALRFVVSFTIPILMNVPYILSVELVGPKHRTDMSMYMFISVSFALMSSSFIASIFKNWRTIMWMTSAPFLLLFVFWPIMPESPRWYIAHEKFSHAVRVLRKLASVNGRRLTDEHIVRLREYFHMEKLESEQNAPQYTMMDLFRHKDLLKITIFLAISNLSCTSVASGLFYYIYLLGGDVYMNFILSGVVQLPGYILLWPFINRFGRRHLLCLSMIISGAACIATKIFEDDKAIELGLFLVGVCSNSAAQLVLSLFTAELYPTPVRSNGLYFAGLMGYTGSTLIPAINYLGYESNLALVILGIISIVGGCFSFMLRETKGENLQEIVMDEQ